MIDKDAVLKWIQTLDTVYTENRQYLTDLDSAIGDADHGINMARGFSKVVEKLDGEGKDLAAIFKDVGMTLVSTVGGASGPLYGTFFLRAGIAVGSLETLDLAAVVKLFDAGLEGIKQRGKAQMQDKTMVDAMQPAVDALRAAADAGKPLAEALADAVAAAKAGMEATVPLQARKGRASYLGERSVGHQDPGATSTYLLFKAAQDIWGS